MQLRQQATTPAGVARRCGTCEASTGGVRRCSPIGDGSAVRKPANQAALLCPNPPATDASPHAAHRVIRMRCAAWHISVGVCAFARHKIGPQSATECYRTLNVLGNRRGGANHGEAGRILVHTRPIHTHTRQGDRKGGVGHLSCAAPNDPLLPPFFCGDI